MCCENCLQPIPKSLWIHAEGDENVFGLRAPVRLPQQCEVDNGAFFVVLIISGPVVGDSADGSAS